MSENTCSGGAGLFSGISNQPMKSLFSNNISGLHTLFSNASASNTLPSIASSSANSDPLFPIETHQLSKQFDDEHSSTGFLGVSVDKNSDSSETNLSSEVSFNDLDEGKQYSTADSKTPNQSPSKTISFWPAVKLSRLPAGLNNKSFLYSQFHHFGNINRIVCQSSLDTAYIAFDSLTAAQRAKRSGHQPVKPTEEGLPSTVVITMSRYRFRTASGASVPDSPISKKKTGSAKSPIFKQSLFSRQDTKPTVKRAATVINADSTSDNAVQQPIAEYSTAPKSMRLENASTFNSATQRDSSQRTIYASTIEERLNVLQTHYKTERDRQTNRIALAPTNQFSASNSEDWLPHQTAPIQGTCPDMCPELERYLRVAHQRVSMFECIPSTLIGNSSDWEMDPTRAVKDYQRSSADQPVPLSCELRPTPILQRTMAYLLATIADRPELETNRNLWKPWYEFMWTRTRAIRKDIVQQGLCCPTIVGIIERIARFHIFCAARLVDQPIDSFDPRINSENLTQCLQTLKEMYHDLAVDKKYEHEHYSTLCPCEPEFRAYMLLMKLNDQSEFSEAQNLPTHIRQSKPVCFAFAVHEALHTKNFIRFFRLARNASCLNACLMHRYFVQIRGQALMLLSGAFAGHPKREVQYPLSSLTRQLAFENDQEAKHFCESWGLVVLDGFVIFEKQIHPHPPELPWREKRAYQLIEFKRSGTPLSELFNGSPTSPTDATPWPVHCSFDTNGLFIGSSDTVCEPITSSSSSSSLQPTSNHQYSSFSNFSFNSAAAATTTKTTTTSMAVENSCSIQTVSQFVSSFSSSSTNALVNSHLLPGVVREWIIEHLPLATLAQSCLAEQFVYEQVFNELMNELIRSETYQVFKNMWSPLSQLVLELRDNLVDSILQTEVHDLAKNLLISASICNDQFQDLLNDLILEFCQSCHMRTIADSFYQINLLQTCFRHFHHLIKLRKAQLNRQILLESMPTCVKASIHPLFLNGERASQIWSALMPNRIGIDNPIDPHPIPKEDRFSNHQNVLDSTLTWNPIKPRPNSKDRPIGLYVPQLTCPVRTRHDTFIPIIAHWLIQKLKHFRLVHLVQWPNKFLADRLSAIICIDPIPQLDQITLPVLALIPHSNLLPKQHLENVEISPNVYLIQIAYSQRQSYVPDPFWSVMLQDGMSWLDSRIVWNKSPVRTPIQAPRSPNMGNMPKLTDVVAIYVDNHFLRPLADLAQGWRARKLVDPLLGDLFDAYHSILSDLINSIQSNQLADHLKQLLTIPKNALDRFISICKSEHNLICSTWSEFVAGWKLFAQTLDLSESNLNWVDSSIGQIETDFRRTLEPKSNQSINPQPLPILAPWITICFATIHHCLDRLSQFEMVNPINADEDEQELIRLVPKLHRRSESDCNYFKLIAEPNLTRQIAYDLSVNSHQRNVIASHLTSNCVGTPKPVCSSLPTGAVTAPSGFSEKRESISAKLNQLIAKANRLGQSVHQTMTELETLSNLNDGSQLSNDPSKDSD